MYINPKTATQAETIEQMVSITVMSLSTYIYHRY
nr:MAG TPA: hypothetical protein [Caudoviricetes sp.]